MPSHNFDSSTGPHKVNVHTPSTKDKKFEMSDIENRNQVGMDVLYTKMQYTRFIYNTKVKSMLREDMNGHLSSTLLVKI